MNTEDLKHRYLEADTSVAEERELAAGDPQIALLAEALAPEPQEALPEAGDEFDRVLRRARRRSVRGWSFALSGIAAVLTAVVFLTRKPAVAEPGAPGSLEMIRQLQIISGLDPADAESYEFKPVGDGFIMTATYADGRTASFLLAPLDSGTSFQLVALND